METHMSTTPGTALLSTFSDAIVNLVASVGRSVVSVRSHRSRASGFVWHPGLIVTASDALADDEPVDVVFPGGDTASATVKGRDASTDVALLAVERAVEPAAAAAAQAALAGALTLVIGAQDGSPVAAAGIVASVGPSWRSLRGGDIDARIELDVMLRGVCEGALAVDAGGGAIGMVVFGPRRRVLVIPTSTIDRVASSLASHGRIARGYLGLGLQPVPIDDGTDTMGAIVMTLDREGPGAAAGIRQGDVITQWNGRSVGALRDIARELGPGSVGARVHLTGRRGGQPIDFEVTVAARPDT
jgi:S1-C subfamily serine protease